MKYAILACILALTLSALAQQQSSTGSSTAQDILSAITSGSDTVKNLVLKIKAMMAAGKLVNNDGDQGIMSKLKDASSSFGSSNTDLSSAMGLLKNFLGGSGSSNSQNNQQQQNQLPNSGGNQKPLQQLAQSLGLTGGNKNQPNNNNNNMGFVNPNVQQPVRAGAF